jgi:hypothetical protein
MTGAASQDADSSYLHYNEDGTLDTSKASARQAIKHYKQKEKERQLKQQPATNHTKPPGKPTVLESSRLPSLKELVDTDRPVRTAPLPAAAPQPHPPAAECAAGAAGAADAALPPHPARSTAAGPSRRSSSGASQVELGPIDARAPMPPLPAQSNSMPSQSVRAGTVAGRAATPPVPPELRKRSQPASSAGASSPAPSASSASSEQPAAALRLRATGTHAGEISGVYQATGRRVGGYPLYKKVDEP